jgi:hypothetical protein
MSFDVNETLDSGILDAEEVLGSSKSDSDSCGKSSIDRLADQLGL